MENKNTTQQWIQQYNLNCAQASGICTLALSFSSWARWRSVGNLKM